LCWPGFAGSHTCCSQSHSLSHSLNGRRRRLLLLLLLQLLLLLLLQRCNLLFQSCRAQLLQQRLQLRWQLQGLGGTTITIQ
jgi:hypothetical protein